ncbi:MAG TPA: ATP-binding protein, partial [Pyrinomonadaceae bacterium]
LGPVVAQSAAQWGAPFVIAGPRRRLLDLLNGSLPLASLEGLRRLHLDRLKEADARALVGGLAQRLGVALNEETRDLLVQQLEASPYLIAAVLDAARTTGAPLTSFRDFQSIYVDELLGGRIGRRYASVLEDVAATPALRRGLLRVLYEASATPSGKSPAEVWMKRLGSDVREFERVTRLLHMHELASFHATYVEATPSAVWRDFLRASYRLQVSAEPRALVVADTLVEALKRAPQTMARHYRREAALGLRELLARFDYQRVPASLLHYDRFAGLYRGTDPEETAAGLDAETDLIRLPQIVHAAAAAAFHPAILQVSDEERCAVAHGFDATPYTDANEIVWLAAEIEAKHEAGRAVTEVWCDRLAQLTHACHFKRVRLWLVAAEGFSAEASELMNERGVFSATRQQLELLTARLTPAPAAATKGGVLPDEFEMVIPMGGDTELIAAHTAEQIARRLEFQPEAINQIKTAVVEACINAAEHSLSPERKIYQRYRVESDKLVITVSSRGVLLPPSTVAPTTGEDSNGRRGWGLKLIRDLMDEVEFERVDDGTRLRMTKYLRR